MLDYDDDDLDELRADHERWQREQITHDELVALRLRMAQVEAGILRDVNLNAPRPDNDSD